MGIFLKEKEIKEKKIFHGQLGLESIGLNEVQQGILLQDFSEPLTR